MYCPHYGYGNTALKKHFHELHFTPSDLPVSTLAQWVYAQRPTVEQVGSVGANIHKMQLYSYSLPGSASWPER